MKRMRRWFGDPRRARDDERAASALASITALQARQETSKVDYPGLFEEAAALFFKVDPAGVNFEDNTDEYEPEVGTVLPRLEGAESADDVKRILTEEFESWFGRLDFDKLRIEQLAAELWPLWTRWTAHSATSPDSASGETIEE